MGKLFSILLALLLIPTLLISASAATVTHTVASGDTLWKLAVKYQVGLSEIKAANPQIKNYNLIYPDDKVNIPTADTAGTDFEQEVIRLVNEIRAETGLSTLAYDWELARVARYKFQDMKDIIISPTTARFTARPSKRSAASASLSAAPARILPKATRHCRLWSTPG